MISHDCLLLQVDLGKSQLVAEEEKVEQDDLNTHEVMSTLTQLLTHMERNGITPVVDEVGVVRGLLGLVGEGYGW